MEALTVLLARRGPADGVLDVLRDLSAVGLLQPFLWVADHDVSRAAVHAVEIRDGRSTSTTVQATLAARNFGRVRLGVVVPLTSEDAFPSIAVHQEMSELLNSTAGGAEVIRARLLIARPGGPVIESAAIEGWHNLLIAPEDSRGPGSGHVLLASADDAVEIGRHAAPAIASAIGMWSDAAHAPLDGHSPPPGQVLRVVRSFYRRFDTTEAENELRRQVFAAGTALPLPRHRGTSVSYVDDSALAARGMAEALWTKHRNVLKGPRVTPPVIKPKAIGILDAIKMFFSFIVAAVRNAPSEWYAGLVQRVSTSVASAVHSTVYGADPSAYSVVFNGVTADGKRAGIAEIGSASGQMGDSLSDPNERREHEARSDLTSLWEDFAHGAMTLADAGERAQGLPPVQIGANRGVLRSVSECVPSDRDRFVVPGSVAALIGVDSVPASDVHAVRGLAQRLRQAESDPVVGVDARGAMLALKEWAGGNQRSYGGQVGTILINSLTQIWVEAQKLLASIKARAEAADISGEVQAKQKRLALWMKILGGALVLLLIASGVLMGFKIISLVWGVALILVSLLAWVVSSAVTFMRGQRDLFREMARRQSDSEKAEADRANLRAALRDLSRLSSAYAQYLAWSKVLGAVLREPFGPGIGAGTDKPQIGSGLPLSTKVGAAKPSADSIANVALQIRRDLFTVGWLSPVWEHVIKDAGNGLGALGQDIRDNPRLLFADAGGDSGSPLDMWSKQLAAGDVSPTGSEPLWQRVLVALSQPDSAIGTSLSEFVEVAADSTRQITRIEEFMAGVGSEPGTQGIQYFDDELFTDAASSAGDTRVADNVHTFAKNGLGAVAVLTQLSDALPEYQFRFSADADAGHRAGASHEIPVASWPGRIEPSHDSSHVASIPEEAFPVAEPPGSGTYVF